MSRKQQHDESIGSAKDFLGAIDKTITYFNDGDTVQGVVVKVDYDEVLVDVGYKTEGVITRSQLSAADLDPSEVLAVGDTVEAVVTQKEDKAGRLQLSRRAWLAENPLKDSRDKLIASEARRAEHAAELSELQALADRFHKEASDARDVARRLWRAMPPEARMTYFESPSSWLPEWVAADE